MTGPRAAIYLRLSRDDGPDRQESMSIANQRAFLLRCLEERGWRLAGEYTDDGYTGANFRRPAFRRLLGDIEAGRVDAVLTKDLSRLGRDQIGTLYYLQVYFPSKGVRYIAVGEGIDTDLSGLGGITTPFLAAANDFYTADISRKVRAALDTRRQNGLFIGASPPLGYQKDPSQKGHLIPDPQAAGIVREIFRAYLTCGSVTGVAKRLTEAGTPTPSAYKRAGPTQTRFGGVWNDTMVRRILTNPTYAGHLTQNRRRKVSYKAEVYRTLPEEEWVTVRCTHEPLVEQGVFDQVQEMLRVRSYRPKAGEPHLLTGLAFCADCGSPMTYVRDGPRVYMVCQGYRGGGRLHLCTSHMVREDDVLAALGRELRALAEQVDEAALCGPEAFAPGRRQLEGQMRGLERQIDGCKRVRSSLCGDRAAGVLTGEEFAELLEENRARRTCLERELARCRQQLLWQSDSEARREQVRRLLRFEPLDRGVVTALVRRVAVHRDKRLEILFRFCAPT